MAIYDFFLSRNNASTAVDYIGHTGRMFYDDAEKVLRVSDGTTPGGFPITPTTLVSTTEPAIAAEGQMWYNPDRYELWAYHNGVFEPTIDLATETKIGGVKLGPGVITNPEGQIIIDTEGLDFSFGNFSALTESYPEGHPKEGEEFAILQTINDNEDAVIASNGLGAVKIVGEFAIYPANGSVASSMLESPVLSISDEGDISARSLDIQETGDLGLMAALNVTLNAAGLTKTPAVVSGSIAQFTGRDDRTGLLVLDTYGIDATRTLTGGELVFRTGRGTNASTTAVQSGDRLGELTAAGWANNGYGGIGVGGLRILANENFTATARGSKLELYVIPNGTLTPTTVATVNSTGITINSGKLALAAGTNTVAPLTFTSGTNLTTPITGSVEYDGKVFYGTPLDAERGIITCQQWYSLDSNRSLTFNTTAAQPVFSVSPNLSANTRYYYRLKFIVSRTTGTNTTSLTLGWNGTATLTRISQTVQSKTGALNVVGTENMVEHIITTNFSTQLAITNTSNAPSQHTVIVTGFINIGANGGTVQPTFTWEGATAAGAVTVYTGSNFQLWPVGSTGANTQIGNWT